MLTRAMGAAPQKQEQPQTQSGSAAGAPDIVWMLGPVSQDENVDHLPFIAGAERRLPALRRHPLPVGPAETAQSGTTTAPAVVPGLSLPATGLSFDGMTQNEGCGNCLPPNTVGDVGPNHYIQSVNSSIRIHDKSGNVLAGPVTYNAFFAAMGTSTPCGMNQNQGDGIVFYDHMADRWVVSDFAFPAFPGNIVLSVHRRQQDGRSGRGRLVSVRCPGRSRESVLPRQGPEVRLMAGCLLPVDEPVRKQRHVRRRARLRA